MSHASVTAETGRERYGKNLRERYGKNLRCARTIACRILLLFTTVAVAGPLLRAQFNLGTVTGTVTDPNGAVVAGAQITLTSNSDGSTRKALTSGTGSYTVPSLQAGTYSLSAEASGFAKVLSQVTVAVDKTATADLQLTLGNLSQRVEVTEAGSAVALEKDTHEISTVVSTKDCQNLPSSGRNFLSIASVGPGTQAASAEFRTLRGSIDSAVVK